MGLGTWTTVMGTCYPSTARYEGGFMWRVVDEADRDTTNKSKLQIKPFIRKKTSVSDAYAAYNLTGQTSYFTLNGANRKNLTTKFDFREASVGENYPLSKGSDVFYTDSAEYVEYEVEHDSSGNASVKIYGYIKGEASSSYFQYVTTSANITLPKNNRPASITALDANIGESTTVFITRKDESHLCTLAYSFGNLSGTIATKTSESQISWVLPDSFYTALGNSQTAQCIITCTTYNGTENVGESKSTFYVSVAQRPSFDVAVSTDYALDNQTMIDNISTVTVTVSNVEQTPGVTGNYTVVVSDGMISKTGNVTEFLDATEQYYTVTVTDARGLATTKSISVTKLIKYTKPAIGSVSYSRDLVDGSLDLTFTGKWWSENVGGVENRTVNITYSIYPGDSTEKDSRTINHTDTDEVQMGEKNFNVKVENILYFEEPLVAENSYIIEVYASDSIYAIGNNVYTAIIPPAVPLLQWKDKEFVVNGSLTVKKDGQIVAIDELKSDFEKASNEILQLNQNLSTLGIQKILWDGAYYMHADHTITLSEAVSEQPHGIVLVFSYYNSDLGGSQNESFSSHFVPKEIVARHPGRGHNFNLCGMWSNGMKYLYIGNTTIEGHANNTGTRTIGGISHNNSYYVLRYVLGV